MNHVCNTVITLILCVGLSGCSTTYRVAKSDLERARALSAQGQEDVAFPAKTTDGEATFVELDSLLDGERAATSEEYVEIDARDPRLIWQIAGWTVIAAGATLIAFYKINTAMEDDPDIKHKHVGNNNIIIPPILLGMALFGLPPLGIGYLWDGPEEAEPTPSHWPNQNAESRPLGIVFSTPF